MFKSYFYQYDLRASPSEREQVNHVTQKSKKITCYKNLF